MAYLAEASKGRVKAFSEMPIDDMGEDATHRCIVELIHGDAVQMSGETRGDVIPAATWRAHGRHKELQ